MTNLNQILELPKGTLKSKKLKQIPDIFSAENIEVALAVINEMNDSRIIYYQSDVLNRAYEHGWLSSESSENNVEINTNKSKSIRYIIEAALSTPSWVFLLIAGIGASEWIYLDYKGAQDQEKVKIEEIAESYNKTINLNYSNCSLNNQYCVTFLSQASYENDLIKVDLTRQT